MAGPSSADSSRAAGAREEWTEGAVYYGIGGIILVILIIVLVIWLM